MVCSSRSSGEGFLTSRPPVISLYGERNRVLGRIPRKLQCSAISLGDDSDRELIYRRRQSFCRQIETRKIFRSVVISSPLSGLTVDDELRTCRCRKSPQ